MLNLDRFLQRSSSSRIIPSRLDITSCLRRRICRFSITSDSILTGITHKLAKNIGGKMNMVVLIDNPRGPKMVLLYGPPRGLASQVCNHLAEMVLLYAPPPPRGHALTKTLWRKWIFYMVLHVSTLLQTLQRKQFFYMDPHVATLSHHVAILSQKHYGGNGSSTWRPTWPDIKRRLMKIFLCMDSPHPEK